MKAPLRLILIMLLSSLAFSCAKLSKITVKSDSRSNIKVLKEEKKVLQKEKVRFRKKLVEDKKADLINHYLKAQYFSYKKNYEKALIEIKKALLLDPKNPEMLMFSAKFLLKIDKYYLALEECQKLLEFNKSHREANLLAGRILYYLGNFEGAISLLKRTLNNNPVPLDAYLLLAHIYRKTNRKQEAEDLLLTVTLKNAKNPSLLFTVAGDLLQRGKIDKAIKYLKKSISINPGNPKPSDLLSYIFEEQGRYEEANKILLNYISNIGFLDTFYFRIGKNFLRLKKVEKAKPFWKRLVSFSSKNIVWGIEILKTVKRHKKLPAFNMLFRQISSLDPHYSVLYSQVLWEDGYKKLALLNLKKLKNTFQNILAKVYFSDLLRRSGKYREGLIVLRALEPFSSSEYFDRVFHLRSLTLQDLGMINEAMVVLRKGLLFHPDSWRLLYSFGLLNNRVGKWQIAVKIMKKILRINPHSILAHNFIGYTLVEKSNNLKEAEHHLSKALSLDPNNGYVLDSMGWYYYKKKQLKKAKFFLEKAHRQEPKEPIILIHLAQCYKELKNPVKAAKYLNMIRNPKKEVLPLIQKIRKSINK